MTTLAKFMILSGGENRPPMLDKDLYDSWQSRMELYMKNRGHGRIILESVKNGPLIWPTIEENGVTRIKTYNELFATEKIQADCDVKATNIILQGLPLDVYALVNHHRIAKDLWERIQLVMQGTSLTKQERKCKLYDEFDKFSHIKQFQVNTKFLNSLLPEWSKFVTDVKLIDSGLTVFVVKQGDDPINVINKMRSFLSTVVTSRFPYTNNQLRNSSNPRQQASIHDGRVTVQPLQGRLNSYVADLGIAESLVTQTVITYNATYQADDLDVYDSDCDKISTTKVVLMANLSSYGLNVLSEEKESLTTTFNVFKNESKEKEAKNINKEIDLEKKVKELDNIVYKMGQSAQMEESRSKMLLKQSNPMVLEMKVNIKPVNYVVLNQLSKDFGKRFVPQQDLSAEQAFWFQMSNLSAESSDPSAVKVDVPSELPKVCLVNEILKKLKSYLAKFDYVVKIRITPSALTEGEWGENSVSNQSAPNFNQYFELNGLKAQSQEKDMVIRKLKESIKFLSGNENVENVKKDIDELETINVELEHSVAKLISKNKLLHKEIVHLKKIYKDHLIQLKGHVFVTTSLQNELRKLKGKNVIDTAVVKPNVTNIAPEMSKLNLAPLDPKLLKNKGAHIDYIKHSRESADILREIVENARTLNPLDSNLDSVCKYVQRIQEVLVYVRVTCPCLATSSEKPAASKPIKKDKKVRFADPITSSSNTKKQIKSYKIEDSNQPLLHSTGVVQSTSASGSRPTGNTNNNMISQSSSRNKTNKVEDQPRSVKITSAKIVPQKKTTPHSVETPKPELKVYSQRPKQIVLWYLDSGCSKHMTRDRSQLTKFVHKFLGTVKFGNDQIEKIKGLKLALHDMTPATPSSGLVLNHTPLESYLPSSRNEWDLVFQTVFDEFYSPPTSVDLQVPTNLATKPAVSTGTHSSKIVDQDEPSLSTSQTTHQSQSHEIPLGAKEESHDLEVAHMSNDPYFGILILEIVSEESLSSNVIPKIEPKAFKDALTQACWIEAMQEELHEFKHLEVWELVPRQDKVMVITLKWIYKITAEVLEIYMRQFWNTIMKIRNSDAYNFKLDKKKYRVDTEVFHEILQICPKLPNQEFFEPLSEDELVSFIKELSYSGKCTSLGKQQDMIGSGNYKLKSYGDIKVSKAYNTYYDVATGKVSPNKVRKFKKHASPKLTIVPALPKESIKKSKRVKRSSKKSTTVPTVGVVIRDTPGVSVSKKKALAKADRGKGIELLSDATLLKDAQLKKALDISLKKSRQVTHKLQANGSSEGTDFESKVPDESKAKPSDTSEGTGVKPMVLDVSKANSSDSDDESWGNSKDEGDDNKNDDDSANDNDGGNDAHDSEWTNSDDGENPSYTLKDYEEEKHDDEYDDEENVDEEEYDDLYKDVNMKSLGASCEQVVEDAHVTLTSSQKTEGSKQSSSISSDIASKFLNLDNVPPVVDEFAFTAPIPTVPPTITMITPLLQLMIPSPVPTTASTTTLIPTLLDFSSLFRFDQRVSTLEKELSQFKQADHSVQLIESVKSQIPIIVDDLLSIRIRYATRTAFQSYTKEFEKKLKKRGSYT
nr:Gag-Pol polyprotein [Tanacetum cinerariifolium]